MTRTRKTEKEDAAKPSSPASFTSGLDAPRLKGIRKLFGRGAVPPPETCAWIFDVYGWLLTNLGGIDEFRETPVVLPSEDFFPVVAQNGASKTAQELFRAIVELAGMESWGLTVEELEPEAETTELMGDDVAFGAGAARTGAVSEISFHANGAVISYAPYLAKHPEMFVSAIAYELARVLVTSFSDDDNLPGVATMEGPLLEIVVTFLGFGVLSANAVYSFEQVQGFQTQGWQSQSLGELSEIEVSYALALFLVLHDEKISHVKKFLSPNPRSYVATAMKTIARDAAGRVNELEQIGRKNTATH